MVKNFLVEELNKRLSYRYGVNLLGQSHFRLVWSEDVYEIRVGTFNEFYGHIFLRTITGPRKCRKYNYINNRWILEVWKKFPPTIEMPGPDNYEPLYVFEDKNGNSLPVTWKVLEIICWNFMNPNMTPNDVKNHLEAIDEKLKKDEVAYFDQMFSNSMSAEMSRFHFGESVILPGKDFKIGE